MRILLIILLSLSFISSPSTGRSKDNMASLIPKGWHILEKVKGEPVKADGDLNKDGISDVAIVIEGISTTEEAPPRALIIAFGNKDKSYTLSARADKSIYKADEGGVWGDPFESLTIDKGTVVLNFYGGSNDRFYSIYKFKFQDNNWFLIGATLGNYFTGTTTQDNADEEDYNFLTGDYVFKKQDEKGILNRTIGNIGRKAMIKLIDFDINAPLNAPPLKEADVKRLMAEKMNIVNWKLSKDGDIYTFSSVPVDSKAEGTIMVVNGKTGTVYERVSGLPQYNLVDKNPPSLYLIRNGDLYIKEMTKLAMIVLDKNGFVPASSDWIIGGYSDGFIYGDVIKENTKITIKIDIFTEGWEEVKS